MDFDLRLISDLMTTCPSGKWLKMMDARMDVDGPSMCRVLDCCRRVPLPCRGETKGRDPEGRGGGRARGPSRVPMPGPLCACGRARQGAPG